MFRIISADDECTVASVADTEDTLVAEDFNFEDQVAFVLMHGIVCEMLFIDQILYMPGNLTGCFLCFANLQVKESIDSLSEKSLATRMTALTSIMNALRKRYVCEFLHERYVET